jgi:hypothetical protein
MNQIPFPSRVFSGQFQKRAVELDKRNKNTCQQPKIREDIGTHHTPSLCVAHIE